MIQQFHSWVCIRLVAQSCPTLCNPMNRSTPGLPVHHQLPSSLRLTSIESVMPSSHLILCSPLLLLPSVFPNIRVFSRELALCIRWPNYRSFSFSLRPYNEYSGLISFRMDWLDLLAVQGPLKNLLQHQFESINSSVLSLLYGPTLTSIHDYWKNHNFDHADLCHSIMSLLFNMLSRFLIGFLPRSKCLLFFLRYLF